jgi:hypothetical protein
MIDVRTGKQMTVHHAGTLTSAGLLYGSHVLTYKGKTKKVGGINVTDIDGHAVVSENSHGNLHLRARHLPVPRPEALGAPLAPSTFDPSTTKNWDTYIPYSLSLGSCHITIKRHGKQVRRLDCTTARRKAGVATVHWNGRAHGNPVAAGTYHWHVHASGGSGAALNAAGHHKDVHGTVAVS